MRNFLRYASDGLYAGRTFHRIMKGFMIQGGDPRGTGGGQGRYGNILGEFSDNPGYDKTELGRQSKYSHVYGVISMARRNAMDSASCQFFIVNDTSPSTRALDGRYASFGKLISGHETLDRLTAVPTRANPRGEMSVPAQKVTITKMTVTRRDG